MTISNYKNITLRLFFISTLIFSFNLAEAQRLPHRGGNKATSRPMSRPKPAIRPSSRPSARPSARPSTRPSSRPTARPSARPSSRPAARPSINGGHNRPSARPNRPSSGNTSIIKKKNIDRTPNNVRRPITSDKRHSINRRHTHVRPGYRPYQRPPHYFGGHYYYSHYHYHYHNYRPYYWGSYYHPWGYFVANLAATAIIVSISNSGNDTNDNNEDYHYENGTYYLKTDKGFEAVQAPIGAQVAQIPKEAEKVKVSETADNYYYGGAFYEANKDGYIVVPATAGTIVPNLPEGGEEVKIGEQTYVQFGETYYQPIQVDGKNMYEIVEVRTEK